MSDLKEENFNHSKSILKVEQLTIQGDQMDEYQDLQEEDFHQCVPL